MQPLNLHARRPNPAPLYFVLADHGSAGTAYVERDPNDMDRETTILDLIGGQIDAPLQVFEGEVGGLFRDVTEDLAREIAGRVQREPIRQALIDFIGDNAGWQLARELRVIDRGHVIAAE
jgi:hypothetical protein